MWLDISILIMTIVNSIIFLSPTLRRAKDILVFNHHFEKCISDIDYKVQVYDKENKQLIQEVAKRVHEVANLVLEIECGEKYAN